jgi:filamentous hemagglutinin family protein
MYSLYYKVVFIIIFLNFSLHANFQNFIGNADVRENGDCTEIISYDERTLLKWDVFNIAEHETVSFIQPNKNSCILNRVLQEPSKIFGSLESNGQVFLLNPNGIIFGENAKVQVNGFLASTSDLEDADAYYNSKDMQFVNGVGSIINLGNIEAINGDIFLISKSVENKGSLIADKGEINLAAAEKILIRPQENKKVYILSEMIQFAGMIDNSGKITAKQVVMQAQNNPYELAIKHTGIIEATGFDKKLSGIYLVAVGSQLKINQSGILKINLEQGALAEVHLLGKEIYLDGQSQIDASCVHGGGRVFIGGSYQGQDPKILKSDVTYIGQEVQIFANSLKSGKGGEIVAWSDGKTSFYGFISARGGQESGNGGLIEVSGKKDLVFEGLVDTRAEFGKMGYLLLDPYNIAISAGADANMTSSGGNPNTYTPTGSPAVLNVTTLSTALNTANVIVSTVNPGGAEAGNITLAGGTIAPASATHGDLTLLAENDIIVSAASTITFNIIAAADLVFTAPNDINIGANLTISNAKNLTMSATNDFIVNDSGAALITLDINNVTSTALSAGRDFTVENGQVGVPVAFSGVIDFTSSQDLTINAGNNVNIIGRVENSVSGSIEVAAINDINVGPSNSSSATSQMGQSKIGVASGDIRITAGNNLNVIGGIGVANTPYAQIGFNAAAVNSDIYLDVVNNVAITASATRADGYAIIGHGTSIASTAGTRTGNIIVEGIGGNVTLRGGTGTNTECFAQIGHACVDSGVVITNIGDIRGPTVGSYAIIGGKLELISGAGTQAYTLIGHGGSNISNNSIFQGNVLIRANDIEMTGGSAQDTVSCIGFAVRFSAGAAGTTAFINNASVKVYSNKELTMRGGNSAGDAGAAVIGGFINTTLDTRLGIIDINLIDVYINGHLTMLGGRTSANENLVLIGAQVINTEVTPQTNPGTSVSNLNLFVGKNLSAITRNGEKIYIQNGTTTTLGKTFNWITGENVFILGEDKSIEVRAIDTLNINVGNNFSMFSDAEECFVGAQNNFNMYVGNDLLLVGHCAASPINRDATLKTAGGDLLVVAGRDLQMGPWGKIRNDGSGLVTVIVDNNYPNPWEMGPGRLYIYNHAEIGRSGGGAVRIFTVKRSANYITNFTGIAFVDAKINNTRFTPGPEYVNSATEIWATYYPSSLGGVPFTIFYKDFTVSLFELLALDPGLFFANYELFYKPFYWYDISKDIIVNNPWVQVNLDVVRRSEVSRPKIIKGLLQSERQ